MTHTTGDSPPPRIFVLPNGMQVLIQEDHRFPLVAQRLFVRAGAAYEQEQEAGISHLLEHMAFKGGINRESGQLARNVEQVGGSLNAATGFDHTVYLIDLPASHWEVGLDILHKLGFEQEIDLQELELEKQVVLSELERNQDSPKRLLFETLQKSVWRGFDYERPVIGFQDTVNHISSQGIADYIARLYLPQSMILVICGDVSSGDVADKVNQTFGGNIGRGSQSPPQSLPVPSSLDGPQVSVVQTSWNKAYVGLGWQIPDLNAPEAAGLEILAFVLGGDRSSRLFNRFQYELGLVDDIAASAVLLERSGLFTVQIQMDTEKIEELWPQLVQELCGSGSLTLSDEEIERAKVNIEDGLFQSRETLSGLTNKLGSFLFFEKSLQAEDRYLGQLHRIQASELQDLRDRFINAESMHVAALLPDSCTIGQSVFQQAAQKPCPSKAAQTCTTLKPSKHSMDIHIQELDSGSRVVLIPDPTLPYTAMDLSWAGGDLLLNADKQGLAAMVAGTLMRGTKSKAAPDIQNFLSSRAGALDGHAGRDQFSMTAKFPVRFSQDILSLFEEVISEPAFASEEQHKALMEQMAHIQHRVDQPMGLLSREAFPFLFEDHPYSFYHLGRMEGLHDLEGEHVDKFWEKQTAQPWVLSVCGMFDEEKILELGQALSTRVTNKAVDWQHAPCWGRQKRLEMVKRDCRQTHILVVFPVPPLGQGWNPEVSLLAKILAGQGGLLFTELREKKGLGYAVSPMLWRTPLTGFLGFYIGTSPSTEADSLAGFEDVVHMLRQEKLSQELLDRAKNLMQVEYHRGKQSLMSRSSEASDLLTYGLPHDFQQTLIHRAMQLTAHDLASVSRDVLVWDQAYTIVVKPEDTEG
mgnify:FL=1